MMPSPDCLPPTLLDSIAAGEIQEPVLGMYLDHLAECDACCGEIARRSAATHGDRRAGDGGAGRDDGEPRASGHDDRFAAWIERLKREAPVLPVEERLGIGGKIGPFRVTDVLGVGASSVVYEAFDDELGRKVVLKVWRATHADDAERRRMIVAEARALAAVQHDAIMPLLQLFWLDEMPVLVFPRLPGETLADALVGGRLGWRDALEAIRQVARGLSHAHGLAIFHHDVKPSNIWLHRPPGDGRTSALLFDFGLAGAREESMGTPGYADPAAGPADRPEARDLFSLGVVLHECLAKATDVPRECHHLVRRLTAVPAERRPDATTVAAEVDRLLRSAERTRRSTLAAVALAAVGLIGLLSFGPWAPAGMRREADSGPLVPESILPPRGWPVAFSADGTLQCVVDEESTLRIRDPRTDEEASAIPLAFRPDRVVISPDRERVAVASAAGDVTVVDVSTGSIVSTRRFEKGVSWIGWSGWHRDALAVLSDGEVQAIFFRPPAERDPESRLKNRLLPTGHRGVIRVASLTRAESMVSFNDDGTLSTWSISQMTPDIVMPAIQLDEVHLRDVTVGWKNPGVCYLTRGRMVTEYASHAVVGAYAVLAPVRAIRWLTDSEYVLLSEEEGGRTRLTLGDSQRPGWLRELDVGDESIDGIEVTEDRRQVVAVTRSGGARVYRVRR